MIITLLDGSQLDSSELTLDRSTYHVFYGAEDVTDLVRQADKAKEFYFFDREKDNNRASDEARAAHGLPPIKPGSTSTLAIFTENVLTKPLDAPLEALDNTTKKIFKSSGVRVILILLALAIGIYVFLNFGGMKLLKKNP